MKMIHCAWIAAWGLTACNGSVRTESPDASGATAAPDLAEVTDETGPPGVHPPVTTLPGTTTMEVDCHDGDTDGECGPDPCDWCNITVCIDGTWQHLEAFPDETCNAPDCDPLAQNCSAGQACYYLESPRRFGCLPEAQPCSIDSCDKGSSCFPVAPGAEAKTCMTLCNTTLADADNACGGSCEPLTAYGIDSGVVGVCVFIGG